MACLVGGVWLLANCAEPQEGRNRGGVRPAATLQAAATDVPTPVRQAEGAEPRGNTPAEYGDWSNANGGFANTRARSSWITSQSVGSLEVTWSVPFTGRGPYGAAAGAHHVADGREVWRFQASGGINAWPAVQDDTILWPVGLGPNPSLIALRIAEERAAASNP